MTIVDEGMVAYHEGWFAGHSAYGYGKRVLFLKKIPGRIFYLEGKFMNNSFEDT